MAKNEKGLIKVFSDKTVAMTVLSVFLVAPGYALDKPESFPRGDYAKAKIYLSEFIEEKMDGVTTFKKIKTVAGTKSSPGIND